MKVLDRISEISRVIGRLVSWVLLALMLLSVADVLLRKFASAPISWAFDISTQMFALHFMLATGFALVDGEHAGVGLIRDRLSVRGKASVDLLCYLVLFMPFCIALLYYGWPFAERSWLYNERSPGAVAMPIAWVKTIIPVTGALLTVQGVVEILKAVQTIRTGKPA